MIHLWTSPYINRANFYHNSFLRELASAFSVIPQDQPKYNISGTHILMVLASWLFKNHEWLNSLSGPKIIVEHDAYLNFLPESEHYKAWTNLYDNCNFDLIITSGKLTKNKLENEGIPSAWVPKGCDPRFLNYQNTFSGKIGYFGKPIAEQETNKKFCFYKSRYEMADRLVGKAEPFHCKFEIFAELASQFSAFITNDATMQEPMAKQFECSALGCAVIRDEQPELYELGYQEGISVISYKSFDDMLDKVNYYSKNKEILFQIQKKAKEVAKNHTWRHRAQEVLNLVRPYIKGRVF